MVHRNFYILTKNSWSSSCLMLARSFGSFFRQHIMKSLAASETTVSWEKYTSCYICIGNRLQFWPCHCDAGFQKEWFHRGAHRWGSRCSRYLSCYHMGFHWRVQEECRVEFRIGYCGAEVNGWPIQSHISWSCFSEGECFQAWYPDEWYRYDAWIQPLCRLVESIP